MDFPQAGQERKIYGGFNMLSSSSRAACTDLQISLLSDFDDRSHQSRAVWYLDCIRVTLLILKPNAVDTARSED